MSQLAYCARDRGDAAGRCGPVRRQPAARLGAWLRPPPPAGGRHRARRPTSRTCVPEQHQRRSLIPGRRRQRHDLLRAAPAQGDAGAAVAVAVHDVARSRSSRTAGRTGRSPTLCRSTRAPAQRGHQPGRPAARIVRGRLRRRESGSTRPPRRCRRPRRRARAARRTSARRRPATSGRARPARRRPPGRAPAPPCGRTPSSRATEARAVHDQVAARAAAPRRFSRVTVPPSSATRRRARPGRPASRPPGS